MIAQPGRGYTLLTGATGFLGHVLLAELLQHGHNCAILVRRPAAATGALFTLLAELGLEPLMAAEGRVAFLQCELPNSPPDSLPINIERIVHAAASTRFDVDRMGEPFRTNAIGTDSLLRWADRRGIREFHLVSTAYSCGVTDGPVPERFVESPTAFRNSYEQSKWMSERDATAWARSRGRTCTIYRPSIIVGDHATGRASRFSGLYMALRALDRCVRHVGTPRDARSHHQSVLRIEGHADDRLNFVPVDHVARVIAHVAGSPSRQGVVYNIVDPAPITNQCLLDVLQSYYGVTGCRFVAPGQISHTDMTETERSFAVASRSLRAYILGPSRFDRPNTAAVEKELATPCPAWDHAAIHRLIDVARRNAWGRRSPCRSRPPALDPVSAYFESFLPDRLPRSGLAEMTSLTTTFRFIVDDVADGEWVCSFQEGRLAGIKRGANGVKEDFAYRMGSPAFFDIVSARVDPQEVFLEGRAEVSGDIEQALKMGMIFQQFNREHPYLSGAGGAESANHE